MLSSWLEVCDCCSRPLEGATRVGFCCFQAAGGVTNFTRLHSAIPPHVVFISDPIVIPHQRHKEKEQSGEPNPSPGFHSSIHACMHACIHPFIHPSLLQSIFFSSINLLVFFNRTGQCDKDKDSTTALCVCVRVCVHDLLLLLFLIPLLPSFCGW